MPAIPPFVLKKLYVKGSLRAGDTDFAFDLKNLVAPATITAFHNLEVDGQAIDGAQVTIIPPSGKPRPVDDISPKMSLHFPIGATITIRVANMTLRAGAHKLTIRVSIKEIGALKIPISDEVAQPT